jgi:hypothetical protein
MSRSGNGRGRALGAALTAFAFAFVVAACSSGSAADSPGGAGGPSSGAGRTASAAGTKAAGGAADATPKLPYSDTCQALTATDFQALGLTLTIADHGLSNVADICFYQVKASDGTTASPSVEFFPDSTYEAVRGLFNKTEYKFKAVSGIGDDAYVYTTLDLVLTVKAKGYVFAVSNTGLGGSVGSGDPEADLETLAKDVVGRL